MIILIPTNTRLKNVFLKPSMKRKNYNLHLYYNFSMLIKYFFNNLFFLYLEYF